MMHSKDVAYIFYVRQFAYDILRRFFLEEPSKEYLDYFVQEDLIDLFPFAEDSEQIQAAITDIKEYLAEHDVVNNDQDYEDLHWDYTRMFIGPFTLPAPPWESVYVRKDRMLFQATTLEVRYVYNNFGFEMNHYNLEAEDHVGLELDFMFHLNELCIEQAKKNNVKSRSYLTYVVGEQSRFLRNHLLAFTPQFSQKVIENAHTQFFTGLAKLLNSYLELDSTLLNSLLEMKHTDYSEQKEERSNA
ncbi:TorD/DmsD family molecular chaperone [Lentibacillus cibarius]|nr:molecular chaperone TorD family protein [Lentibacillus cibarius]